jgi:hypothetical protein
MGTSTELLCRDIIRYICEKRHLITLLSYKKWNFVLVSQYTLYALHLDCVSYDYVLVLALTRTHWRTPTDGGANA